MKNKFTVIRAGRIFTVKELSEMYDRQPYTIRRWIKSGAKSLLDIIELNKRSTKSGRILYDSPYGRMSLLDIVAISGCERDTAYARGCKYGFDSVVMTWPQMTKETFIERIIQENITDKKDLKIPTRLRCVADGIMYPLADIAAQLTVSVATIRGYVLEKDCFTLEDCARLVTSDKNKESQYCKDKEKLSLNGVYLPGHSMETIPNRLERCHRRDATGIISSVCKRYSACVDSVAFNFSTPKAFRSDGSCYVGEPLKVSICRTFLD